VPGWVAKPRRGGSSVGTAIARTPDELEAAVARALAVEDEVLVEELVPGTELTVGVVTDPRGAVRALTPIEIRPHAGRFFDYDEKYRADGALELCPPSMLDAAACARLADVALRAHAMLGCEGYSRSDFIVPLDGGEPVFLELNTLPGLTPRSLLPKAAAAYGIDYRTLCLWIAASGLARGSARHDG
jgi:D-alanine-D-alanine ligase